MEIFENYEASICLSFGKSVYQEMLDAAKDVPVHEKTPKCFITLEEGVWKDNDLYRARVKVCAILPSTDYKIHYLLKWDKDSSKPEGNHLGQLDDDLSGRFLNDRDYKGNLITNPNTESADNFFSSNRKVFYFEDVIGQIQPSGVWTFKITIKENTDHTVIAQNSIEIDWDNLIHSKK